MPILLHLDENAPWKQRFRAPDIWWTQIAPANPIRGLVITNTSGKYQLYAWDVPSNTLRQLTARPTGILEGWLSGDGRYVYYLDDQQGNEIGHFVRIPFAGGESQDITPDLPPYSSWRCSSTGSGGNFGFMAADEDGFTLYHLDTKPGGDIGTPHRLFHRRKLAIGPYYSYGGEVAVVNTTDRSTQLQYNLLALDTSDGAVIAELWDGEGTSIEPLGFSPLPGDFRLAAATNKSGVKRPTVWNPYTGERVDITLPELSGEIIPLDWSRDASSLLLCQITQAVQQLYLCDLTTHKLKKLNHPSGTFENLTEKSTYFKSEGEIFTQWQDATHPSQLIALNAQTGEKTRLVLAAGDTPPGRPWKSITFPSSDGQMIQGWLGLPEGTGPFPTILHTHGGPESVITERFHPGSQCWLDYGFAFLTVNYRGSTTFGREFQEKIWGNVGNWEVEDIVSAREWLVREGIANPDQIFLTGWSYGGFNTLMALSKRPDLWAGGIAGIAVADWAVMYEDSADTLKGYMSGLFGGTPQEIPEQYAASSPITYAQNVRAPILIIQGRNDTRTPARQVEMYEARLKALGKPIEVHWFDAGHLGVGVELDIHHQELMLRFAQKVMGNHKVNDTSDK